MDAKVPATAHMVRDASPNGQHVAEAKVISSAEGNGQLLSGLHLYTPIATDLKAESEIALVGSDFHQMLQINLKPGQIVTAEPGSMVMMSGALDPTIESGGCKDGCRRCCCAGEHFFRLAFENTTQETQFIALTPPQPGKIIPLDLSVYSGVTLTSGAFLGALGKDWRYNIKLVRNAGTGCCGGQGFFLTELHGSGTAFIHAMGTVEMLELKDGQQMVLENSSLVAFEKTVRYDIRQTGGCLMCCCGGMGLFNVVVTGPGRVVVQSLSLERLRRAIGHPGGGGGNNNNRSGGGDGKH